jgi:hypothetical protein
MSDFTFSCPHCSQRLRCDERHSGRRILCPKCKRPIIIPGRSDQSHSPTQAETRVMRAPCETLPPASSSDSIAGAE